MYSIGEFSKINRVTTKTLRHYDEIGLLRPNYIDKFTGYRYYDSSQLPRMSKILALKQMGFSLTEIIALLELNCSGDTMDCLLKVKRQEITDIINEEQSKLLMLENFLKCEKGDFMSNYTAIIKELPEVIVASYRKVIADYSALNNIYPQIMAPEMKKLGCKCTEPNYFFNIYHDGEYKANDIDAEVCEAVTEKKKDTDVLKFKVLPKVPTAVCVYHKGAYQNLGNAYGFAVNWAEQNGYKIVGEPRESYIDGMWNKQNEEDWLTEIQFPVEKI